MKLPKHLAAACLALADQPPPLAERISEKQFQAALMREARGLGWKCYHTYDSRRSEEGFPDFVAMRAGVQIAAELKVDDNKPTAAQLTWLEHFAECGAKTFVWYPRDWPEILKTLR